MPSPIKEKTVGSGQFSSVSGQLRASHSPLNAGFRSDLQPLFCCGVAFDSMGEIRCHGSISTLQRISEDSQFPLLVFKIPFFPHVRNVSWHSSISIRHSLLSPIPLHT